MFDIVTSSCVQDGVMMLNNCAKFKNYRSMDKINIWGSQQTLSQSLSKKGHNSVKMFAWKSYLLFTGWAYDVIQVYQVSKP